jgi:hypothetical protein
VIDPREEYNQPDPWGEFEEGEEFAADHIYGGDHEVIENLVLMTEVYWLFEHWADDFRYWDRCSGRIAASRWEEESAFSELQSIKLASTGVREP